MSRRTKVVIAVIGATLFAVGLCMAIIEGTFYESLVIRILAIILAASGLCVLFVLLAEDIDKNSKGGGCSSPDFGRGMWG